MSEFPDGRVAQVTYGVESLLALGREVGGADLEPAEAAEAAANELARRGYHLQDADRIDDVVEREYGIRLLTFARASSR